MDGTLIIAELRSVTRFARRAPEVLGLAVIRSAQRVVKGVDDLAG